MTATMIAFHGDPQIKKEYLARVRAHRRADELVKGRYWENGKGCAVGCTIHGSYHSSYEEELGIPEQIAWLEDVIFEGLPNEDAMAWPERFLESIPVGADLSMVFVKFAHWLLAVEVQPHVENSPGVKAAIDDVASLLQREINGDKPLPEAYMAEAKAAKAAAESVARSVAWSARAAARAAAWSAKAAAWSADAAADAAWEAADAAWEGSYKRQSEKLLELLAQAPVAEAV